MNYAQQRSLAIAVTIVLGMLGMISIGNADALGLSPRIVAWLTILATGLGLLQGFLPNVRGTDQQPEHIANRIMDLSRSDRLKLLAEVESRGAFSKQPPDPTADPLISKPPSWLPPAPTGERMG